MWPPDPVNGSWHNVYSLLAFQPALIPYHPLREALGSDPNDNFQGLRLVRDHRVDLVLQVLGIRTITRDDAELNQARTAARTLEGDLNIATSQLVAPERSQTHKGTYVRTAHEVVFRRTEALLVSAYTAALLRMPMSAEPCAHPG
jgi:pyruvate-formate lyase-activating enzyme